MTKTEEEFRGIKKQSEEGVNKLQISLTRLLIDLNHPQKEVQENAVTIATAICGAVEDAVKNALKELKGYKNVYPRRK